MTYTRTSRVTQHARLLSTDENRPQYFQLQRKNTFCPHSNRQEMGKKSGFTVHVLNPNSKQIGSEFQRNPIFSGFEF